MAPLPAVDVVRLWERGRHQHPVDRALTLLELADRRDSRDELSALSIGDRDRRLLELRRRIFGDRLDAETECPRCGQRVEIAIDAGQLAIAERDRPTPASVTIAVGALEIEVRPADSRDLAAAAVCATVDEARRKLLDRCVIRATGDGASIGAGGLTDEVAAEVAGALAELDPQANTELKLCCPQCHGTWDQSFDVGDFLWGEVVARARRLLRDVHVLAWAYGWSEREILSLSDARRHFYLEQVERWQTT